MNGFAFNKIDPGLSEIPDDYFIDDYRKITDFKKQTYSGYQKSDVLSALQKSIMDGKVEEACNWAAEMLVSGNLMECWDRIIILNSKLINIGNPCFPFYLWTRFAQQIQIIQEQKYQGERVLTLRNNQECRNHLTDIITILTLASKNKIKSLPKITTEDFRLDIFETKLEAKHINLLTNIIKPNDPSEVSVVMNEFAYQIKSGSGNLDKALYWFNWIMEWEKLNIKRADGFNCAIRTRKYIKPQYYHDIVWMIWDVIFQEASIRNDERLNRELIGLFKLFKYNFTSAGKRKKSPLIVHSLYLMAYHSHLKWDKLVCENVKIYTQANANTNLLYMEFKKRAKNMFHKKEESLQVITRNNYLVSDQKVNPNSVSGSTQGKKKDKIGNDVSSRLNLLDQMDKMMINKNSVANLDGSNIHNLNSVNSISNMNTHNTYNPVSKQYQSTEDVIAQIQSLIS